MQQIINYACIVILLAVARGCNCQYTIDDYLELPDADSLSEEYHQDITRALQQLNVESGASPKLILEQIKLASKAETDPIRRKIYERLVSLSDNYDVCSQELVDQIKSIMAQTRANVPAVDKIKDFVGHYGLRKFELCGKRIDRSMSLLPGSGTEQKLDQLFTKTFALGGKPSDAALYKSLRDVDFQTAALDVEEMVHLARRSVRSSGHKDRSMTLLRNFLDVRCIKLDAYLGRTLDIINLGFAFGSELRHSRRILKLDVYHRLCSTWRNPRTRIEIEKNIMEQAESITKLTQLRRRRKPKLETLYEESEPLSSL